MYSPVVGRAQPAGGQRDGGTSGCTAGRSSEPHGL